MAYLEEMLQDSFPLKPKVWWRYIDDIFLLWEHGEEIALKILLHVPKVKKCHLYISTKLWVLMEKSLEAFPPSRP